MTMMFRRTALGALAAAALSACGGGGADRTKAQVRLVNASAYPQLDLRVHGSVRQGQVSYGSSADYIEVDPDDADTQLSATGSATALLSFTPAVSKRKHYTVLAYGAQGALKQLTLDEDTAAPDTNKTLLRVLNAAPDAGALDIYLTDAGDDLATAVAVQANAAYSTLGGWTTIDSRSYRLRVTALNNKADVRLDISDLVLSSKQVATLVLTSASGGVLVNGLLVMQQGSLVRADVAYARVRAVAGVGDNAAVQASIGNKPLLGGFAAPAIGPYTLIPVTATAAVLAVGGSALPWTLPTLTAGLDYTLLVYGTAAQPLANLIADDNRLPADTSMAHIRLVNGVADAGQMSLTVDASPIGSAVSPGAATDYALVSATTTAEITATSANRGELYTDVDRTLLAGSTYSVFVLGAGTTTKGLLRKDR